MRQWALTCLVLLWAGPALALSCMRPDPAAAFHVAAKTDKTYVVVNGTLAFDETKLLKRPRLAPSDGPRPTQSVTARFNGQALNTNGFVTPFDKVIRLDLTCAGAWCASAENEQNYLAFIERQDAGYVLSIGPCRSNVFESPNAKVLRQMQSCFNGGWCQPKRR